MVNQRAPRSGRGNQTKTIVKAVDAAVAATAARKLAGAYPRVAPGMLASASAVVPPKIKKSCPSHASGPQRYTTTPSSANSTATPLSQSFNASVNAGGRAVRGAP